MVYNVILTEENYMSSKSTPVINNLVAKHARTYNKAHTMIDRKKRDSTGYKKHRKKDFTNDRSSTFIA